MEVRAEISIAEILRSAEEKRCPFVARRRLDAWRVANGPGDGAPAGLTVDRYASWLVLSARETVGRETAEAWATQTARVLTNEGVVLKVLGRTPADRAVRVFAGSPPGGPIAIREEDAVLLCDVDAAGSTGLFLDHRETRLAIRPYASGVEVLNLFAHAGAFSVHAALAGATRVTSVDVSRKGLRRARENMERSGLDPDRHRWFDDDVIAHVARQARRGPRYGLVIADPPVFGHAKGAAFALERELDGLIAGCVAALLPGGVLVVSTHALALSEARLLASAEAASAALGRPLEIVARLGLPEWDHPVTPEMLEGAVEGDRGVYLKTLVLRAG